MTQFHKATLFLMSFTLFGCNKAQHVSKGGNILVWQANNSWNPQLESEFQAFVQRIGDARWAHNLKNRPADLAEWKRFIGYDPGSCVFLKDCIKNPKVNPLYSSSDEALTIEADCGDVPGILRSYFSFKKGLPFIYEWETFSPEKDHGIFPPIAIVDQANLKTLNSLFSDIRDHQHAHFYRTPIEVEHTDTYPVRVSRDTIKPGTVAYFVGGHAMMVFRIKPDGEVLIIQGHPGEKNGIPPSYFSVGAINGTTMPQDFYYKSGGFRNWRPYTTSSQRTFSQPMNSQNQPLGPTVTYKTTGNLVYAPNKDLPDLDRNLTNFQKSYNVPGNGNANFYQFIKSQLCSPGYCGKTSPTELREKLFAICNTLRERQDRVNSAIMAGLPKTAHPGIPVDVYNAGEPWESQSTPGFDVRLRASYGAAIESMRDLVAAQQARSSDLAYSGSLSDMINLFQGYLDEVNASKDCQVAFQGDSGSYTLGFKEINSRLYDLSFDPYHCPELRWGIQGKCDAQQAKFYNEERRLRNVSNPANRPAPNDFDANGLPNQTSGGPAEPPSSGDRNFQEALNALKKTSEVPVQPMATNSTRPAAQPPVVAPQPPAPVSLQPAAATSGSCAKIKATGGRDYDFYTYSAPNTSIESSVGMVDPGTIHSVIRKSGNFYVISGSMFGRSEIYIPASSVQCL